MDVLVLDELKVSLSDGRLRVRCPVHVAEDDREKSKEALLVRDGFVKVADFVTVRVELSVADIGCVAVRETVRELVSDHMLERDVDAVELLSPHVRVHVSDKEQVAVLLSVSVAVVVIVAEKVAETNIVAVTVSVTFSV